MFEVKDQGQFEQAPFTQGVYTGVLTDIKILESKEFFDDDGNPSKYRLWIFEVTSPKKFKGEEIAGSTGMAFTPKAKGRLWAETIVGRELEEGEKLDIPDLMNKPVHLNVVPNKGKTRMYVENIFAVPKEEADEVEADKATEEDFESIPF